MYNKIINYQPRVVSNKVREFIMNDYAYEQYLQFIRMNQGEMAIVFFNVDTNELLIKIDVDGHETAAKEYGIMVDKNHLMPGWYGIIACASKRKLVIFDRSAQFGDFPSQYKLDLTISLKNCFKDSFPDTPMFNENSGMALLLSSIFGDSN